MRKLMERARTGLCGACLLLVGLPALAASGCDDLSAIAETANVDYESQIQPIWNANCAGCHTNGGSNGGLKLDAGQSLDNLVRIRSTSSSLRRVEPGQAAQSFLFQKLNCDQPDAGARMPQGGQLSMTLQALVRDWINQGALAQAGASNSPPQAQDDRASTAFGEAVSIDVLANDSDADGDTLSLVSVADPAQGTAVIQNGQILYTPDFGFSGSDGFSYSVSDGQNTATAQVSVSVAAAPFELNFGLSGSWFNAATDGQGFVFEVVPDDQVLVVYWYTYASDGQGGQQWLVGAGPYSGNRAMVDLQRPAGGLFDQAGGVVREDWGSVEIVFTSCTEGEFHYSSTVDGVSGSIPMVRITADPLCQALLDQQGAQ